MRKNYHGADVILYLPEDTPTNSLLFVSYFKPRAALFIKYEFWYGYLQALKFHNIPAYLVSGIFRPNQYFFKLNWLKPLQLFTHFFVQNYQSFHLLKERGFLHVEQTGDTRFDRVSDVHSRYQSCHY